MPADGPKAAYQRVMKAIEGKIYLLTITYSRGGCMIGIPERQGPENAPPPYGGMSAAPPKEQTLRFYNTVSGALACRASKKNPAGAGFSRLDPETQPSPKAATTKVAFISEVAIRKRCISTGNRTPREAPSGTPRSRCRRRPHSLPPFPSPEKNPCPDRPPR